MQNYIDNTGVQVADVVVGLVHLEGRDLESTRELLDELARRASGSTSTAGTSTRASASGTRAQASTIRRRRLRPNWRAESRFASTRSMRWNMAATRRLQIADLISTAVLRRHLETMERLSIEYDFLPRESEILSLHFWDAARTLMLERGVLYLETEGKNKGCYVMRRAGSNEAASTG